MDTFSVEEIRTTEAPLPPSLRCDEEPLTVPTFVSVDAVGVGRCAAVAAPPPP